jgi:hypothetical protein
LSTSTCKRRVTCSVCTTTHCVSVAVCQCCFLVPAGPAVHTKQLLFPQLQPFSHLVRGGESATHQLPPSDWTETPQCMFLRLKWALHVVHCAWQADTEDNVPTCFDGLQRSATGSPIARSRHHMTGNMPHVISDILVLPKQVFLECKSVPCVYQASESRYLFTVAQD